MKMPNKIKSEIKSEMKSKIKRTKKSVLKSTFSDAHKCHRIFHKFSNWIIKTYGKDLHGKWTVHKIKNDKTGKIIKFRTRSFNDLELSRRLVGYEVMCRINKFVKRCCPEIKIIRCDDSVFSGSDILLIPHPKMGITIMFIPQCTTIQNQFFLYDQHYETLMKELTKMKKVYKGSL